VGKHGKTCPDQGKSWENVGTRAMGTMFRPISIVFEPSHHEQQENIRTSEENHKVQQSPTRTNHEIQN
jgi:hypothetical protein